VTIFRERVTSRWTVPACRTYAPVSVGPAWAALASSATVWGVDHPTGGIQQFRQHHGTTSAEQGWGAVGEDVPRRGEGASGPRGAPNKARQAHRPSGARIRCVSASSCRAYSVGNRSTRNAATTRSAPAAGKGSGRVPSTRMTQARVDHFDSLAVAIRHIRGLTSSPT
jgi:hypothetical protein